MLSCLPAGTFRIGPLPWMESAQTNPVPTLPTAGTRCAPYLQDPIQILQSPQSGHKQQGGPAPSLATSRHSSPRQTQRTGLAKDPSENRAEERKAQTLGRFGDMPLGSTESFEMCLRTGITFPGREECLDLKYRELGTVCCDAWR